MGKIWRAFSGLADFIQVASFGGLTLGGVVVAITAIAGYTSQLPWFWILVAAALLAWTTIFLFDRFHLFQKATVETPTPPSILEDVVEYVPVNEVAVEVYGKTRGTGLCNFIESVATRNGKLDHSSVLNVCATYIADTTVPIFGKHPPSIEWEKLDRSIFKSGRFENGSFHRYGHDDAEFTQISILASDRDTAVNQIVDLAVEVPVARSVEEQWAEHDAAFKIASLSKGDARKELWRLSGYRLGVVVAPDWIVAAIEDIQTITSLRAPAYAQYVLTNWLRDDKQWLSGRLTQFAALRDMTFEAFRPLPWLAIQPGQGTAYAWPDISRLKLPEETVASDLLVNAGVLVSPGYQFGANGKGHFRVCFARDETIWKDSLKRMVGVLGKLARQAKI